MSPPFPFIVFAVFILISGCAAQKESYELSKIAFGSCARQDREQPIWRSVAAANPELWIWLGDNIYGDTADANLLEEKYAQAKAIPGYAALRETTRIIGTWDDHDYGVDDGGKKFAGKIESQKAMLDFLDTPEESPRRKQEGVYWSYSYGAGVGEVKVILLDCRYHRDDPSDPSGDILGEKQWTWLETILTESKASLHVIASGIQVLPEDHPYEKWMQLPKARERLFDIIVRSEANGVIFLSGDRHIAEISRIELEGLDYPIYDITSSSLTHSWRSFPGEVNRHRVGEVFSENNFGLLEIDWERSVVNATIRDEKGVIQRSVEIAF